MIAPCLRAKLQRPLAIACGVLWLGAFTATHVPLKLPPMGPHVTDRTLHTVGFAGLTLAYWLAMWSATRPTLRRLGWIALLMPVYAALDELTQPLVNRVASIDDWAFDMFGMLLALVLAETLAALSRRKAANSTDNL